MALSFPRPTAAAAAAAAAAATAGSSSRLPSPNGLRVLMLWDRALVGDHHVVGEKLLGLEGRAILVHFVPVNCGNVLSKRRFLNALGVEHQEEVRECSSKIGPVHVTGCQMHGRHEYLSAAMHRFNCWCRCLDAQ